MIRKSPVPDCRGWFNMFNQPKQHWQELIRAIEAGHLTQNTDCCRLHALTSGLWSLAAYSLPGVSLQSGVPLTLGLGNTVLGNPSTSNRFTFSLICSKRFFFSQFLTVFRKYNLTTCFPLHRLSGCCKRNRVLWVFHVPGRQGNEAVLWPMKSQSWSQQSATLLRRLAISKHRHRSVIYLCHLHYTGSSVILQRQSVKAAARERSDGKWPRWSSSEASASASGGRAPARRQIVWQEGEKSTSMGEHWWMFAREVRSVNRGTGSVENESRPGSEMLSEIQSGTHLCGWCSGYTACFECPTSSPSHHGNLTEAAYHPWTRTDTSPSSCKDTQSKKLQPGTPELH